jgi:hypothetical protein
MTRYYVILLYELIQLKANMDIGVEVRPLDRLRGGAPGNYERVDNLMRKVIDRAALQVNSLSDMSVTFAAPRAPGHEFAVIWWEMQGKEFQVAMQERAQP